ncbi:hypothetical protein [Seonamhaeicola sp.]|uniref:hypothetical protein n=1 Tax=Seonamhaeicola sp. TaxID=1912245 RepID=UPI002618B586|nr:hypothetical protein [Seonamhaeicola sp.]
MDTFSAANDFMISFYIGTTLSFLALLIMLVASIILIIKIKSTATYLMLFGSILKIVMAALGTILPILSKDPEGLLKIQGTISLLSGLSVLIFAIGLIMLSARLARQHIKS